MKKVKLALIGAGKLGGYHADKIAASEISELTGIYDPSPENAHRVANKHSVPILKNLKEALSADGVVIAAPSVEHAAIGLFFLRAGKHVLIEKPIASTASEAAALRYEANKRNLVLQTGHTEKFNPAWQKALPLINAMIAENPVIFDAVRTSPYSFRCADVGTVLDVMIHDLELVLSAVRSPVASVTSSCFTEFGGHEDVCEARVTFQNGSAARFFGSRTEQVPCRIMKIYGRGKRLFIDFAKRRMEIVTAAPSILNGDYSPEKIVYSEFLSQIPDFMKNNYTVSTTEESPVDPLEEEEKLFANSIAALNTVPSDFGVEAVQLAEMILAGTK